MADIRKHLDAGSLLVIVTTLALFTTALFVKGLGHDLLLEGGVFLVSVKLVVMGYKDSVATREVAERLDDIRARLSKLDRVGEAPGAPEQSRPAGGLSHRSDATPARDRGRG
jgi:hypothetical protein